MLGGPALPLASTRETNGHNSDARSTTASFVASPEVLAKSSHAVKQFERGAYLVLKLGKEGSRSFFENLLFAQFPVALPRLLSRKCL